MRLVFLGSDAIALPVLEWLAGDGRNIAEVVGVFTQPDRPVGRGQQVQPNEIKTWALGRGVPLLQPEKLTAESTVELAELRADVALVMAYGHILKTDFIATPRLGTLNLHTSLLPHYRGASPIQTAIASGERETGVTLMRIVRQLDAGPVAGVERVPIDPRDTAADVEARLAAACVPLIARALPRLAAGTLEFREQDHTAATFCRRLKKEDGALDFTAPAPVLAARINGLHPWPSCALTIQGVPIKAGLALATDEPTLDVPGTVLGTDAQSLRVATGRGVLHLLRLQRPGGRMIAAPDFLRGFPLPPGTELPSTPMPPLVGPAPFR